MKVFERLAPEQHDTLPDIPEPRENPFLLGHEGVVQRIGAACRMNRLHHGLLLHGPRGIGKATFAFRLAYHLLSHPAAEEAPDFISAVDPQSDLYRQIARGVHPAVLHLARPFDQDGKRFKTAITVDEVRRVNRFLSMTTHDGGYRIVIVDPAEDMNTNAANALLKNLEEPPKRSLFVLVSHLPGRLLPTIRSRCQAFRFQPLSDEELLGVLEKIGEEVPTQQKAREKLLERAGGSPRNAILMTRYGGTELADTIDELLSGGDFDMAKAHKLGDAVNTRGAEIQLSIVNETFLDRIADRSKTAGIAGDIERSGRLSELWQQINRAIWQSDVYNLDRKQHVVDTLIKMREALSE